MFYPQVLDEFNIKYVLNVTMSCDNYFEDKGITYKRIAVKDSGSQKLTDKFQEAFAFIGKRHLLCMSTCLVLSADVCVNVYKFSTAVMVNRTHDIHTHGFVLSYLDLPFSLFFLILSLLSLPNISSYFPPHYLVLTSPSIYPHLPFYSFLLHTFFTFINFFLFLFFFTHSCPFILTHSLQLSFSQFVEEARKSDSIILIHCMAGVSRSVTFTIAYLMTYFGLAMQTAYQLVKDKRPVISPNLNFMGQLVNYEEELMKVQDRTVRDLSSFLPTKEQEEKLAKLLQFSPPKSSVTNDNTLSPNPVMSPTGLGLKDAPFVLKLPVGKNRKEKKKAAASSDGM